MKNKSHKGFECMDCRKDTWDEYYMVNNRIWKKVNPNLDGKLCIGCLENRLERKLVPGDFTDVPVNKGKATRTARLKNRLGFD